MAAALGLDLEPGDVVVSLGTSGTVFSIADRPTADPSGIVAGFADATGRFLPLVCTLNAARVIDLDLLDFRGEIAPGGPGRAILPHPRLEGRAFVVRPLADLAPNWRHPRTGTSIQALLAALPAGQVIEKL